MATHDDDCYEKMKERSNSSSDDASPERIVRAKELQELTGLSRTTLWQLERVRTQ